MGQYIDIKGQRFGRLVALEMQKGNKRTKWKCKCDCGNVKVIQLTHLKSGATTSCGCYQKEMASKASKTHGKTRTPLHNRWKAIKQRCLNPKNLGYRDYGGRGISVCDEWLEFQNFYNWAINNGYKEELALDRIDNNKGYFPENCRWITTGENNRNRRDTIKVEGLTLHDISEKYSIKKSTVLSRYYELKYKSKTPTIQKLII